MFLAIINFDTLDLIIKNVAQYHNGGTIIEMTTAEAADYLKKNDVKEELIKNLDLKVVFKDRAYLVVIQFVPLTFNPNSENEICKLKQENDWEEGAISMACWIKPPNKRTDQQRVTHLLVTLKNPNNANKAIRNGVTLNKN
ncbi:uncharacterized protein BJ212DRAFT_1303184 [Suillus subaureus]|uniref:Uncharacterized protein n=1 Tax=Suillus subaureus TaxID=48587 RepID=A0A9P7E101_9AGAM|nr:uncharacterized protein BJ212DRAFT_1303184 [Suillus subaureus]KAG1807987.1 hypothetical protein BJ212DRAFT_1303184 [Suillus subaureus]